jgi:hypothetical protein
VERNSVFLFNDKPEKSEDQGKKIADSVNSAEVNGKDVFSGKDGQGVPFVLAVLEEEEEEEETPASRPSPSPSPARRWQASDRRSARNSWLNYFNFLIKKLGLFFENFWGFFSWQVLKVWCEEV